ncbi:hypothetical protein PS1_044003 [Malus domestica]
MQSPAYLPSCTRKTYHFLIKLIQNAEDNEYEEGVEPTLEFVMTKKDITGSGASATLLVFNNEVGFSRKNMDSICSVGRSTKKGKRQQVYWRKSVSIFWCKAPRLASVNLGIFIFMQCSGIHKSLGVHISKVRSATLDT